MRPRALLLATAIAATAFGGAAAEPLDRAGFTLAAEPAAAGSQAEFVLRGVVDWLNDFVRDNPAAPLIELSAPVHAVGSGSEVVVSFPDLALVWDDGTRVRLGDVVVPITPREDGAYDFAARLPARYEFSGAEGGPSQVVTVGESRVAGTWSAGGALLTGLEVVLRDVALASADAGPPLLSIAALDLRQTLSEGTAGTWRGSLQAELSGVQGGTIGAATGEAIAIDRMDVAASFEDVSSRDWVELSGRRGYFGSDEAAPRVPSMRLSAEFGLVGLAFTGPPTQAGAIGESRLRVDLGRKEQDLWDIGADFSLSEFSASGFEGGEDITIGEVAARSQTVDFPLTAWRQMTERFGIGLEGGAPALSESRRQEFAAAIAGVRWGSGDS
ncbi:MAG TPA: hypothetical protein QF804_01140, partial [Rhodospirillales bacterium]|nr:hypothetical protein [Rhodospirillales bacterium]